ncbi:MAG: phytoene/squalene synthase family protein [Haliangium ochraceum]
MTGTVTALATVTRRQLARRILSRNSRSFSWGARLLPAWCRRDATALYAWCRRCDDAVDVPRDAEEARAAVARLRSELDGVYSALIATDPVLAGFQEVVRRRAIPRRYADDLIDGMAMDVGTVRYANFDELLLYCYRVAGTVGLMMAHIMNVRDAAALRRATDLGIAMQLTNICRDVAEDERRDRIYVPVELWEEGGAAARTRGPTPAAVAELLRRADGFYRSGDQGLPALPLRCAVAIRAARLIYADIGNQLARRGFDFRAGRVFVPAARKLRLALVAIAGAVPALWRRLVGGTGRDVARDPAPRPLPFALPFGVPTALPISTKGCP